MSMMGGGGGGGSSMGMMGGMGMSLLGTGLSALSAEDKKKQMEKLAASFKPIDLQYESSKAIAGNLANLPAASKLTEAMSTASQYIHDKMLHSAISNYDEIRKQQLGNINALTDTDQLLKGAQRGGAAFGISSGTKGSQFAADWTSRQLGLDRSKLLTQQTGLLDQYLQSSYAMQKGPEFNLGAWTYSPQQQADMSKYNQETQLNMNMNALNTPGAMDVWGSGLQGIGGAMMGMSGAGGGGSGGGGGGQSWGGGMIPMGAGGYQGGWSDMMGGAMYG